jgi:NADPH2:quinone reductase
MKFEGQAWRATEFGSPKDVLRMTDATWEEPTEGRVLIRVAVCGIGYPDVLMTTGNYPMLSDPPVEPGQEVVGQVVAAPAGSRFSVGDRVMGFTPFLQGQGGLGTFAYGWEDMLRSVPGPFSDEEAAGFLIAFKTAHHGLVDRTTLMSGETLLVLGGAGSSGSAAIQFGKALGATVIAAGGSPEKLAFCKNIGADHVVNYRVAGFADEVRGLTGGRGVDVIYDPVGGDLGTESMKTMAPGGRFVLIGFASGSFATVDPLAVLMHNWTAVGVLGGAFESKEVDMRAVDEVWRMADAGLIRTPVGTVFPFSEVPGAIDAMANARTIGKSVVRVAGGPTQCGQASTNRQHRANE